MMKGEGEFDWKSRITIDPNVMGGKPVLRGRRIPVETIVGALAGGTTRITQEDIQAALSYAAQMLRLERVHALPRR